MSTKKTPGRRSQKPTEAIFSPTRITRLEEKTKLQHLNNRLEQYILKQRERDASQGVLEKELAALRDLHEQEMKNARAVWEEQIQKLRTERDDAVANRAELEHQIGKLNRQLEDAQNDMQNLEQDNKEAQERLQSLTQERADLEVRLLQAQEAERSLENDLSTAKRSHKDASKELASLKDSALDAEQRARLAESRANGLQEDLDILRDTTDAEIQRLRDELADLTRRNAHIEEQTRKEFSQQLADILKDRQKEFDEEKDEALEHLKKMYDEKLEAYRDHLARAGHELEEMKNKMGDLERNHDDMQSAAREADAQKQALEDRVAELEQLLAETEEKPNKQINELKEIIRRIKASFKRKDKEFDDLMDVKIALAMEIKQYQLLLDKEEKRLAYSDPATADSKKRKRSPDDDEEEEEEEDEKVADAAGDEDMEAGAESQLVISSSELHGKHITVKNASTSDVNLDGWSLQTEETKWKFEFPSDVTLMPGHSVTVHTGDDAESNENPPSDYAWVVDAEQGPLYSQKGDTVMLVDPNNDAYHEVKIVPEFSAGRVNLSPDKEEEPAQKPSKKRKSWLPF